MEHEKNKVVGGSTQGCCGVAAPVGVAACCVEDADKKAAGESGCGCNNNEESKAKAAEACC